MGIRSYNCQYNALKNCSNPPAFPIMCLICLPCLARDQKGCLTETSSSEASQRAFFSTGKTRSISASQTGSKPMTRTSRAKICSKFFFIPSIVSSQKSRLLMLYTLEDKSPNALIILQDCRGSEKRNSSKDSRSGAGRKTPKSYCSF